MFDSSSLKYTAGIGPRANGPVYSKVPKEREINDRALKLQPGFTHHRVC